MAERRSYHHGALRAALLAAARGILAESGPAGLTLRACARRAGVSHAAPKHHFPDKTALLTAVAAQGFREMAASMDGRREAAGSDSRLRLHGVGMGYIAFALHNPAVFKLMYGDAALHFDDPELAEAADGCFARLVDALAAADDGDAAARPLRARMAWTSVHGFATLWLTGALQRTFATPDDTEAALAEASELLTSLRPFDARPPHSGTCPDGGA